MDNLTGTQTCYSDLTRFLDEPVSKSATFLTTPQIYIRLQWLQWLTFGVVVLLAGSILGLAFVESQPHTQLIGIFLGVLQIYVSKVLDVLGDYSAEMKDIITVAEDGCTQCELILKVFDKFVNDVAFLSKHEGDLTVCLKVVKRRTHFTQQLNVYTSCCCINQRTLCGYLLASLLLSTPSPFLTTISEQRVFAEMQRLVVS